MKDFWLDVPIENGELSCEIREGFKRISRTIDANIHTPVYASRKIISELETNFKIYCDLYESGNPNLKGSCVMIINKIYDEIKKENVYKLIDYKEYKRESN